jgi:hypothetical protein
MMPQAALLKLRGRPHAAARHYSAASRNSALGEFRRPSGASQPVFNERKRKRERFSGRQQSPNVHFKRVMSTRKTKSLKNHGPFILQKVRRLLAEEDQSVRSGRKRWRYQRFGRRTWFVMKVRPA